MKKLCTLLLLSSFIFLLGSCSGGNAKTIEITGIGWYLENIPADYWSDPPSTTCIASFQIYYEGSDISASDVQYARFHEPGDTESWYFDIEDDNFDYDRGIIGPRLNRFIGDYANTFPIGPMVFEVKLKSGKADTYTFNIPEPGKSEWDGADYVYTQDFTGTPGADYARNIDRASVSSATKGTDIRIAFSVDSTLFYNGYVWFYDSDGNYLGISRLFRSRDSGNVEQIINSGGTLNMDGITANQLIITPDDIDFDSVTDTYADISRFRVVLTDGEQYATAGRYGSYDCRSISENGTF